MSSGARSAGNRIVIMLGHPYECAQLFHEIGPIGLFIKYKTSFTFRDEDDDDDDTILTCHTYAKLLHLPDGHIPSIAELSPVFAALNILHGVRKTEVITCVVDCGGVTRRVVNFIRAYSWTCISFRRIALVALII